VANSTSCKARVAVCLPGLLDREQPQNELQIKVQPLRNTGTGPLANLDMNNLTIFTV
jgi:hypothetical protein